MYVEEELAVKMKINDHRMSTVLYIACNLISKTVRQFFIKNVVVLGCLAYIKIISHTDGKNLLICLVTVLWSGVLPVLRQPFALI